MLVNRRYPVRAEKIDWRDRYYNFARGELRPYVDLRPWASPVEDQLRLGSCTGQAVVGAYELLLNKNQPDQLVDLSRLFVYYNARLLEDGISIDQGAYVKDAIKAVRQYGICTESLWPYNTDQFTVKPTLDCYNDAKRRTIKNYYRLVTLQDMLDALNADHPVVFSLAVYPEFDDISASNPVLAMPKNEDHFLGGHAMTLVGYDLHRRMLLARNSFGTEWGEKGYCWIPFDYAGTDFMDTWVFDINLQFAQ